MTKKPRLLMIISFHHACNDGTLIALVALLPILVEQMDLSYYDVGLLGFGLLITVVAQYMVGRFADRQFSRYMLEAGAFLMGVTFVLLLFVDDFVELFLAVISMRLGAAFYHPVGISWITKEYAGEYLDTALGVQSGVGNLGVIIALGSSGFLGELLTWKAPCLLWAGLNFAAVIMGILLIRGEKPPAAQEPRRVVQSPVSTASKMAILIIPIIAGGALYQITTYFGPIKLTKVHDWTAGNADLVFAVWIAVGTLTSYYFGTISARLGKKLLLALGYLASLVAILVMAVTAEWFLITPVLVVYGAFLFTTYPALFSFLTEVTDPSERATAFGILFGFQLGGGAVFVYLSGFVADALGSPDYAFFIGALLSAASLGTILLMKDRHGLRGPAPGT
jgi:predicted MFS family arabinose efflux permease